MHRIPRGPVRHSDGRRPKSGLCGRQGAATRTGGHLTVFLARTRGPFWSYRPSWILLTAVIGTQTLATAIALTGFLMQPIGWNLAGLAWGWALTEFLLLDPLKLLAYRVLERHGKAAGTVSA
ncbi:hypothetical protein ACWDAO_02905 [Streptomyces sp. NPDC001212]